jgi:hypothetical protein
LTIGGEACHWSHRFSWKAGEICLSSLCCSVSLGVVFDLRSRPWYPAIRADEPQLICVFLLDLIPPEESTLLVKLEEESQLCPGLKGSPAK